MTRDREGLTFPQIRGDGVLGWDLLRLEGYVSTTSEEIDGELFVDADLVDVSVPACGCANPNIKKHGPRTIRVKDFPIQRMPTTIRLKFQRWRCQNCRKVLQPPLPGISTKRDITERFLAYLEKDTVAMRFDQAAAMNGVEDAFAIRVFDDYAERMLGNYTYDLPRVLGMDEKVLGGRARFVVGDVESRHMLDMLMSRKQADLEEYFRQWDFMDRAKVEVITQDMYWGYKTLNERYFRNATIVIDKFHVVRYANVAVDSVRKQIQAGLENNARVQMKKRIKLLAARPDRLSDDGKWALSRLFKAHPAIETAVTVKEWFYDIYECETRAEAEKAFDAWVELIPVEMRAAFRPITSFMQNRRWRKLIFNYFDHRYTNAYVESLNGLLDTINRDARGLKLSRLRAKALLRYGKVKPLTDEVAFDLMSVEPEERERILLTSVGHGVDLSTFERDLMGDAFW